MMITHCYRDGASDTGRFVQVRVRRRQGDYLESRRNSDTGGERCRGTDPAHALESYTREGVKGASELYLRSELVGGRFPFAYVP